MSHPDDRSLLGLHFAKGSGENPPLGDADADSSGCEGGDCDRSDGRPIRRAGLCLALLVIGFLCVAKGVYQIGESFALTWRDAILVGVGGIGIVQGMLHLLVG